jgi:hypothetical protein
MNHLSSCVRDEEEHVESPKPDGLNYQQAGRPDALQLVGKEGPPSLRADRTRTPPAVSTDRTIAHPDSQLEELAADPLAAPKRVLPRHEADQFADFGAQAGTAQPRSGLPGPVQSPALPVPPDDGLRLNEDEVTPPPTWPQLAEPDPEDAVVLPYTQPRIASERDLQLMAEGKILQHQRAAATKRRQRGPEQEIQRSEHPPEYQRVQCPGAFLVFGSAFAALQPRIRPHRGQRCALPA